jgi:hypothetical protein
VGRENFLTVFYEIFKNIIYTAVVVEIMTLLCISYCISANRFLNNDQHCAIIIRQ